jgi:hypothetical protein
MALFFISNCGLRISDFSPGFYANVGCAIPRPFIYGREHVVETKVESFDRYSSLKFALFRNQAEKFAFRSMFNVQCSMFDVGCSMLSVERWAFGRAF